MNAPLASADVVARNWLFKKKPPPPIPQHAFPAGGDDFHEDQFLDKVYVTLRNKLIKIIESEINGIRHAEVNAANRARIDPMFFDWFLIQGEHWPSMPKRTQEALYAIRDIYFWYGKLPNNYKGMEIPELSQGHDRDNALKALGGFFLQRTMKDIERKFQQALMAEARKLKDFAKDRNIPYNKMPIVLLRDFQKRMLPDRFSQKPAVQRVVFLMA
jgi:hypothetical protein